MTQLSDAGWKAMGMQKRGAEDQYSVRLSRLIVYQIEGFHFAEPTLGPFPGDVGEAAYVLAIGKGIHETSRLLVGDDLTEDEMAWTKHHNATGPYLLIHLETAKLHPIASSHIKFEGETILTNGGFDVARGELDSLDEAVVPAVIASLTVSFAETSTRFRLLESVIFGTTDKGQRVHDLRFQISGSAIVSKSLANDAIAAKITKSQERALRLNQKAAGFMDLALREVDRAKQFLLYFIAIEILITTEFQRIKSGMPAGTSGQAAQTTSRSKLVNELQWLKQHAWTEISANSIDAFNRLRLERNRLVHGSVSDVAPDDIRDVKSLALELFTFT